MKPIFANKKWSPPRIFGGAGALVFVPPERRRGERCGGLGAHSPHQAGLRSGAPVGEDVLRQNARGLAVVQPAIQAACRIEGREAGDKMTYAERVAETNGPISKPAA